MIKLIRFIAVIVALISFWSVYSRPEIREAFFMMIEGDFEEYESDYDSDDDDGESGYEYSDSYDPDYDD